MTLKFLEIICLDIVSVQRHDFPKCFSLLVELFASDTVHCSTFSGAVVAFGSFSTISAVGVSDTELQLGSTFSSLGDVLKMFSRSYKSILQTSSAECNKG